MCLSIKTNYKMITSRQIFNFWILNLFNQLLKLLNAIDADYLNFQSPKLSLKSLLFQVLNFPLITMHFCHFLSPEFPEV